ncbi:MAG TPA: M48 family metalloprotease [Bryobacteraceae bacterium]|nr:M48 family metalloprotease [Bryobacteraceae bacterium]
MTPILRKRGLLLAVLIAAAAVACAARQPGETLRPGFNLFTKEQDTEIGREASQQVRQQYQVVQNQFLQDYIKRVGDRLAATPEAKRSGFTFTFTMLNDPAVNAFALPGGPMFILSGLVKSCDNEAQLAGVMGHEMSHVILRHGTHAVTRAKAIELPALLADALVNNGSVLGQLAQVGIGLGANSLLLHYSRDSESEADALGTHLMAEAGYDPSQLAVFFQKLQASGTQGSGFLSQFLSDHPNPGNRQQAIQAEIRTLPQRHYNYQTGEFEKARAAVRALPPPKKRPEQG